MVALKKIWLSQRSYEWEEGGGFCQFGGVWGWGGLRWVAGGLKGADL